MTDESTTKPDHLPRIFYEGGSWLIWTVDELEVLYKTAKIIGSATMTAPHFPRQSAELALPIEIMPCEAKWCFENHFCILVTAKFKIDLTTIPLIQLPQKYNSEIKIDDSSEYEIEPVDPPKIDPLLYKTYTNLKNKKYWISTGINFGCNFMVYQSEPWKCHSFALVWCESEIFDTRKLIQHVRIAESTKKSAIASFLLPDGSVKFLEFSRFKTQADDADDELVSDEDNDDINIV